MDNAADLIKQSDQHDRELLAKAETLAEQNGTTVEDEFQGLLAVREQEERAEFERKMQERHDRNPNSD